MALPAELTTTVVREASDEADASLDSRIDGSMDEHIEDVIAILDEQFHLTNEQINELTERIAWRLELLPPSAD